MTRALRRKTRRVQGGARQGRVETAASAIGSSQFSFVCDFSQSVWKGCIKKRALRWSSSLHHRQLKLAKVSQSGNSKQVGFKKKIVGERT